MFGLCKVKANCVNNLQHNDIKKNKSERLKYYRTKAWFTLGK